MKFQEGQIVRLNFDVCKLSLSKRSDREFTQEFKIAEIMSDVQVLFGLPKYKLVGVQNSMAFFANGNELIPVMPANQIVFWEKLCHFEN